MKKKKPKSYVIFGVGKFGGSVATELMDAGNMVLAVDRDEEKISAISDNVTKAVIADVNEPKIMDSLGLSDFDAAIVATTGDLSASVMCTILCKEAGIPYVIVKVQDELQQKVFEKLGADKVIIPEYDAASKVAQMLITRQFLDVFELSENVLVAEMPIVENWSGKTLRELDLRKNHKINLLAVRENDTLKVNWDADKPLPRDCSIIVLGERKALEKLQK